MLCWASIFTGGIPKNRLVNSAQNACDRSLKHAIFDSGDAERAKFFGIARFWEYTPGAHSARHFIRATRSATLASSCCP